MTLFLKFRVLASCLTSRVNCLSPWVSKNFLAPLEIEQTLSLIGKKVFSYCVVHLASHILVVRSFTVVRSMAVYLEENEDLDNI